MSSSVLLTRKDLSKAERKALDSIPASDAPHHIGYVQLGRRLGHAPRTQGGNPATTRLVNSLSQSGLIETSSEITGYANLFLRRRAAGDALAE